MRILILTCVVLASCGANSIAASSPTPAALRSVIPWLADRAHPTPLPAPAARLRPSRIRDCETSDVVGVAYRGGGAGGWWLRGVILGNRSDTPCVVAGPLALSYLDAIGVVIASGGVSAPTWDGPGWAILEPTSPPADDHVDHPGQARITMQSYGDCEHRELRAIAVTFAAPSAVIQFNVDAQPVGGRCDVPEQRLSISSWPVAPTTSEALPTPPPLPLTFAVDAPAVTFAGETLTYMVRARNIASTPYAWGDGCPIYLEWLPGRDTTPPLAHHTGKWEPPASIYVGSATELHPLNCAETGELSPGSEVAFEMRIAVPPDALGADTLHWEIAGPLTHSHVSAPLEILPPRR
jgi:hypothetical protein